MRKSCVKIFVFYENTMVLLCMQFWKLGFALLQNEWIQGDSFTSTEIKGSVLPCLKAYFRIWGQGCGICTKGHQKPKKGQDKTKGAKEEKNFMTPFYGWGLTVSGLQNHSEEAVCFLPLKRWIFRTFFEKSNRSGVTVIVAPKSGPDWILHRFINFIFNIFTY